MNHGLEFEHKLAIHASRSIRSLQLPSHTDTVLGRVRRYQ